MEPLRAIPDERDQISAPPRPDLRCREHETLSAAIRSLHKRMMDLEARVPAGKAGSVEPLRPRLDELGVIDDDGRLIKEGE
jgi:hypothetical protein